MYMLPKLHCELNLIEWVWEQAKQYARAYCKYSIKGLRSTIMPALNSVAMEKCAEPFPKGEALYVCVFGRCSWWF